MIRRGITPVVAIALLMGMTVVASGGAYAFFTTATQQGMDEASASLSTEVQVRSIRCEDTSAVVGISNTGDRELAADTASVFLSQDGELLDTVEKDVSSAEVLQPGGFSELDFPFTTYLSPGTRYTVEVRFPDADYSFERNCQGQTGNLIGYWNFDEITSRTISDLSVNGNDGEFRGMDLNGTFSGMPYNGTLGSGTGSDSSDPAWTSDCQQDGCLSFDGGDRVVVGSPSFPTGNASRTITAWAKMDSGNDNTADKNVAGYGGTSTGTHFGITYGLGSSYCWGIWGDGGSYDLWSDGSGCSSGHVELDRWYHLAAVYDGTTEYLYIDGELANSKSVNLNTAAADFEIGSSPSTSMDFPGDIDEVRVYDQALSQDEIESVMDGDLVPDDLIAHYPFDEGSGQTAWNNAYQADGQHGSAVRFDGSNQYLYTLLGNLPDAYSFSMWIKTDAADQSVSGFSDSHPASGGHEKEFYIRADGRLTFRAYDSTDREATSSTSVDDGEWHHIAATAADNGQARLYVDGEQEGQVAVNDLYTGYGSGEGYFTLGIEGDLTDYFNGTIDDVRVYTAELSAAEIQADMNGEPPQDGILTHYSFDGPEGRTVWNNAYWKTGKQGGALTFDGSDDQVFVGDTASLEPESALTLAAWVKPRDVTSAAVNNDDFISKHCYQSYRIGVDAGGSGNWLGTVRTAGGTNGIDEGSPPADTWTFVTLTFEQDTFQRLYLNGSLLNDITPSNGGIVHSTKPFLIGRGCDWVGNSFFNGTIDEARVYDTALTKSQVQDLYNATR